MTNVSTHPASGRPQAISSIDDAMTDFCAILQALKATAYGEESGCARDFLCEKLEEVYQRLEAFHRQKQVH